MATSIDVLGMLIPNGGYVQVGEDYEGIQFIDCKPITKKQYEDGFAQFDKMKAKQDAEKAASRAALFEKLGITEEEAQLLLS